MAASRVLREEKKFIDVSLNRKFFSEDLYQSRLVKSSIKNKNKNVRQTYYLPILSAILQNFDP